MKCKTCNGLGRTKATEFIGVDEGLRDVVILCPTCGGKGEIELTEQEWLQTADTEQLAEWIAKQCGNAVMESTYDVPKLRKKRYWVEWLKQPHHD